MKRWASLAAAALIAALPALAQDTDDAFSLEDYGARIDEALGACRADASGPVCRLNLKSVLPSTVEAISALGYQGQYETDAPLLRRHAALPWPEIRAAALYALARLGARAEDLPLIREGLLSDVSGVRRAAIGALKALPDAHAQELYKRAVPEARLMPSGAFRIDPLPFDPAESGLAAWPQDTRYLHFENRTKGTYIFITAASASDALALFEAQAGAKAVGMGAVEARYGADFAPLLAPWIERNAALGAVQAVVLKSPEAPSSDDPAVLALVYEDYALGATGFALVRLPGEPLPRPRRTTSETPDAPDAGREDGPWYAGGDFVAKDGASDADSDAWREVLEAGADAAAATAYLAAFPQGAWRPEAEAILAAPRLETDMDIYAETDVIKLRWTNVPVDAYTALTLGPDDDARLSNNAAEDSVRIESAAGEAELRLRPYIEPGVYEARIVDEAGEAVARALVRIALAGPSIGLDRDSVKPGESVVVTFAGMPGNAEDAIGITEAGEQLHARGRIVAKTGGATEGTLTLTAPTQAGAYEVRAWFGGDVRVRAVTKLTVRGPDAPPPIDGASGPAMATAAAEFTANETILVRYAGFDGDTGSYIALAPAGAPPDSYYVYAYAREVEGIVELKLPAETGAFELRAVLGRQRGVVQSALKLTIAPPAGAAMATLALDKTRYAPGETIVVEFSGMSGSTTDYVAAAKTASRYTQYVSYLYTKGEVAGRIELKAPNQPGDYEVRAFFNEDESVLRGAVPFVVAPP